jgi:hypothetical protein
MKILCGGLWGALVGAVPGLLFLIWASWVNPFFLDAPVSYLLVACALPGLPFIGLGLFLSRGKRLDAFLCPRWLGGGLAVLLFVVMFFSMRPRPRIENTQLLVLGWDGATFSQIDPLVAAGKLPHVKALRAQGSSAVLRSMEPMFSPLLWTTMATGKPPEAHGVQGFSVHASDVKVPRFWDLVAESGQAVGIYKWLVTYPPRAVNGFMVPAWLAPEAITWPVEMAVVKEIELSNRLERKGVRSRRSSVALLLDGVRQGFRWSTVLASARWKLREWRGLKDPRDRRVALEGLRVQMDRDVFVAAAAKTDPFVLTLTLYATDSLGHRFWKFHEPQAFSDVPQKDIARFGGVIEEAYVQADAVLGELVAAVADSATVVLLSDHGFQALQLGAGNKSYFAPKTTRLQARLRAELGPVDVFRLGQKLTVALLEPTQSMEDLRGALSGLVEDNADPFFVLEVVPGAPRSIGLKLANEGVTEERIAAGRVGGEPMGAYVELGNSVSGDHHPEGIFVVKGPGIAGGKEVPEMRLLDVAPTLQGILGYAPAADLTGVARFGGPTGGPASRDDLVANFQFLGGTDPGVNDVQLRALGYVQ